MILKMKFIWDQILKPVPRGDKIQDEIAGKVVLKVGDNISTDHIVPSDSKLLPYRSNVPYLAKIFI